MRINNNEFVLGQVIVNFLFIFFSKSSIMWLTNFKREKKILDVGLNRTISTGNSHIITSYQICSQFKLWRRDYHSTGNEFVSSCSPLPWQPAGPDFPEMQHQIQSTKSMLGKCLQSFKCPCNWITVDRSALPGWHMPHPSDQAEDDEKSEMGYTFGLVSWAAVALWTLEHYLGPALTSCGT